MKKRIAIILVGIFCVILGGMVWLKNKEGASASNNDSAQIVEPVTINISAVGDIMLGRYVATLIKDNFEDPFSGVKELFADADIKFGNLECVLSDNELKNIKGKAKNFCLKGPADMVNVLNSVGFNILSLANNHMYDYDSDGVLDTIKNLHENDIKTIGAGKNIQEARALETIEVKGKTIGFLAYTDLAYVNFSDKNQIPAASDIKSGVSPLKEENILEDMEKAKDRCDLLFISLHWSDEYTHIPKTSQVELAHRLIDAGADGILGHHAHNLQGVELYQDKPIIYNMGNFIFDQNDDLNKDSAVFNLTFIDEEFERLEIIPCRIEGKKKTVIAEGEKYDKIVQHLLKFSSVLGTELKEEENKLILTK